MRSIATLETEMDTLSPEAQKRVMGSAKLMIRIEQERAKLIDHIALKGTPSVAQMYLQAMSESQYVLNALWQG